ncbi:glycoside hydrolase family 28 protein [Neolewinella litorea]|uniref:Glycoside hydrolase family 28 protein n=1 Tax=Neolewinella litorea TaxID=2562452 RepID=A0A4S4NTK5_9BACT|nr:glycoside hydrolase family 28 protein [Neolewinella litorea]THH41821.1 glycoside hydrolase family 28 protein [Neolewinella litorea]
MTRYLPGFLACLLFLHCQPAPETGAAADPSAAADPWAGMEDILSNIQPPEFPDRDFDITAEGAVADGRTDALPALRRAIEKCTTAGGGRVVVPAGDFYVKGPIHLKSNVNLHLSEGATLKFSTTPEDYLPAVHTRWEGVETYNYSPLIYAYEQENIAITGSGTLDGQASNENWWPWSGSDRYGWKEGMPSQADDNSRPQLYAWNTNEVPLEQRRFEGVSYLRPNFIQPFHCKNILIDGVTILNSPMWVLHPTLSENVTIQNVRVISHGPNSDGCDPESCNNVLIRNCYFDTGDDCIALKSGRNQDGRNSGRPIENVVIQDCEMKDGHGGVVIGSEVSGGARNIFAENCIMDSPNLERAIRVKTNKVRGGTIENLYFRNITVGEVREAVVRINMRYAIFSDTTQVYIPTVRNILIENVTSKKSRYGLLLEGYSPDHPITDVQLIDCKFEGVAEGNKIEFVDDLTYQDYYLNGELVEAPVVQ